MLYRGDTPPHSTPAGRKWTERADEGSAAAEGGGEGGEMGAEAGTAAATATGDYNETGEMCDEAVAAREKSEEAAAPEKKTKRSKQPGRGDRRRSGSAGGWTAPSGSRTLPSSYVVPIVLDPQLREHQNPYLLTHDTPAGDA